MNLHWQILPEPVVNAFRAISGPLASSDFYLAGGTALTLHLGHRVSEDLDLFSPSFESPNQLLALLEPSLPGVTTTLVAPRTLYLSIGGVQVSLFGYGYALLAPTLATGDDLLPLADPDDIAAMKLAAIAQRGSRKDFLDVWALVRQRQPLREYLALFERKFASRDLGHVLRSLAYFDDADRDTELYLLDDTPWDQVKDDFVRWVSELV
jgi:hypothetical protein